MKSYICAILLLMSGMAHCFQPFYYRSMYPTYRSEQAGCQYNDQFFPMGEHKLPGCKLMNCEADGQVIISVCQFQCPPGKRVVGERRIESADLFTFPGCCKIPICENL